MRHKCLVIAYAVHDTGRREVIGLDVGESETESFWREFLRVLVARGLAGVQLVVSDAHPGLKTAINSVLGCPWQRCTVHFLRDMLGHVQKARQQMVGAAIRQVFAASGRHEAHEILGEVVERLAGPAPKVARLLEEAEPDLLAFLSLPAEHRSKLRSTNPLERVNREIGRRSDVVGIDPNDAALVRLASMLLIEQNDEWLVGRRYLSRESIALVYADTHRPFGPGEDDQPALEGSAGRPRDQRPARCLVDRVSACRLPCSWDRDLDVDPFPFEPHRPRTERSAEGDETIADLVRRRTGASADEPRGKVCPHHHLVTGRVGQHHDPAVRDDGRSVAGEARCLGAQHRQTLQPAGLRIPRRRTVVGQPLAAANLRQRTRVESGGHRRRHLSLRPAAALAEDGADGDQSDDSESGERRERSSHPHRRQLLPL